MHNRQKKQSLVHQLTNNEQLITSNEKEIQLEKEESENSKSLTFISGGPTLPHFRKTENNFLY